LLAITILLRKIDLQNWSWKWTILAAASITLFQGLFFSSIRLTGVAVGTVATIGSAPVFFGILEWLVWKARPTLIWGLATLMAIIGCLLLFMNNGDERVHAGGFALALCVG
ncbi:EamA family transporter, partial [Lysinibacillus sp. D4B2_S17]|uniref:EamA family transporter n=1 Tax=Lysinibacillus sp. D4B2_S17 TaxID=2941225 RepID=UPI0020C0F4FB